MYVGVREKKSCLGNEFINIQGNRKDFRLLVISDVCDLAQDVSIRFRYWL